MSIMGYPEGIPPPPPSPPWGGGGGKGLSFIIARLRLRRQAFSQKKITFFCTIFLDSGKDFKCKRQVHARKKVKKNIRKMWTNLSLSSNLWAWKTKSNGRIWWTSKLTVALQRWLTSQAHSARCWIGNSRKMSASLLLTSSLARCTT